MGQEHFDVTNVEERLDFALGCYGYDQRSRDLRARDSCVPGERECWLIPGPEADNVLRVLQNLPGYGYLPQGYRLATDAMVDTHNTDGEL